jgi:hypothetical protein
MPASWYPYDWEMYDQGHTYVFYSDEVVHGSREHPLLTKSDKLIETQLATSTATFFAPPLERPAVSSRSR